jgi:MtN3 and saliva related transmembrane protein
MEIADTLAYIATIIGLVTFTPQVVMTWKTKNAKSISLASYTLIAVSSTLWFSYGMLKNATPIIIANFVICLHALALILLKLNYDTLSKKKRRDS